MRENAEARERDSIAAEWVAREDHGALAPGDLVERDAWLAADVRHFGAYARAHAVFARTRRARALSGTTARPAGRRARRWMFASGLAAGLALLVIGVHVLLAPEVYATRRGEVLRVTLADASVATLDSDSLVRVRYSRRRRDIELVRGEALFDVARNHDRPFVVVAGGTSTTAVGTSFAVSLPPRGQGRVEVLVREGIVDVADQGGADAPARLLANHRALAEEGRGIRVEPVAPQRVRQALTWREGMLAFNGDTLSVAAARFLRYSSVRIVIDDPRVGSLRIVGRYAADDPAGFARSVALSLGLSLRRQGDAILLEAQAPSPGGGESIMTAGAASAVHRQGMSVPEAHFK